MLLAMGHEYEAEPVAGAQVPTTGPLIVVANYAFGLLDPLVLGHFLAGKRDDLKILTGDTFGWMPEMEGHLIRVKALGSASAVRANRAAMKQALAHVKAGGGLLVFPSGEVAHYRPGKGVQESPWSDQLGGLVRCTGADVLPVHFSGRNSLLFQATGLLHKRLRASLITREFLEAKSRRFVMRVGQPIPFAKLKRLPDDETLTMHLRISTLMLGQRDRTSRIANDSAESAEPVMQGADKGLMSRDVDRLDAAGKMLAGHGALRAYVAESHEIPHLLHEIGRQREIAFRAAGEGTGSAIDLDRFDRYYLHIFVWDSESMALAGAYRLGRADEILKEFGSRGLYTNTLFKFRKPFLVHLKDAVEMGRSFVAADYQRNMATLPLLWKAVVTWIGQHPKYRKLFGPVSISKDYDSHSQRLMVDYLSAHHGDAEMDQHVLPRKPFRSKSGSGLMSDLVSMKLADADECSAVISSLETDGKGFPVLLKHYLRLNGTILSFNVDAEFSNVLDGLVMVDMLKTDPRLPAKLMGAEAWAQYLAHHS